MPAGPGHYPGAGFQPYQTGAAANYPNPVSPGIQESPGGGMDPMTMMMLMGLLNSAQGMGGQQQGVQRRGKKKKGKSGADRVKGGLGGAAGGAASGAMMGSVVPGLGTAAGAIIGGILGGAGGAL